MRASAQASVWNSGLKDIKTDFVEVHLWQQCELTIQSMGLCNFNFTDLFQIANDFNIHSETCIVMCSSLKYFSKEF